MLVRALTAFAALLLATISPAQCPDQGLTKVKGTIEVGRDLGCGGARASIPGASFQVNASCPAFILYTPAHTVPTSAPGSCLFARQVGTVDVVRMTFQCRKTYLLFIPVWIQCEHVSTAIAGQIPTYGLFPCECWKDE